MDSYKIMYRSETAGVDPIDSTYMHNCVQPLLFIIQQWPLIQILESAPTDVWIIIDRCHCYQNTQHHTSELQSIVS